MSQAHEVRDQLCLKFMTDLDPVQQVLGLQIKRSRSMGEVFIHQTKDIEDLLGIFGLRSCSSVSTPLEHSMQLSAKQPAMPSHELSNELSAKRTPAKRAPEALPEDG